MGLTLIRKSAGAPPPREPVVALVLAGGAISGGAFKVGGLKALDDCLAGRRITDLDCYVGLSAGSILATSLASGITPDEMIEVLEGTSARFEQLRPRDFYQPNLREFATRPARYAYDLCSYLPGLGVDALRALPGFGRAFGPALRRLLREPSRPALGALAAQLLAQIPARREIPSPLDQIPSGLFDNSGLERWVRGCLDALEIPDDFRAFEQRRSRRLYISACDLDTAKRVIFGADENCELTISEAVRASSALPVFYRPARINGVDYVDGGVRHTANIDIAIEKGADLVICYNPFRPMSNRVGAEDGDVSYFAEGGYVADRGLLAVVNQTFRTLLHSRLVLGIQRYLADERFRGDILLLEPREHDASFFAVNPLAFWKRADAVRHGFESVRRTILHNLPELQEVLGRYGLELDPRAGARRARARRSLAGADGAGASPEERGGRPPLTLVRGARV